MAKIYKLTTAVEKSHIAIDSLVNTGEYLVRLSELTSILGLSALLTPEEFVVCAKAQATSLFQVLDEDPLKHVGATQKLEQLLSLVETLPEQYLYSWNMKPNEAFLNVLLEEDVRDALQGAVVLRPNLDERKRLLELSDEIGIQFSFVGFPAVSPSEFSECGSLVNFIELQNLSITPILMSRAVESDLAPIIEIQKATSVSILVDLYICTCPLRMKVEGWTLENLLRQLSATVTIAKEHGLRFRIAFEDSSRTPPNILSEVMQAAIVLEPECIVINDTVGDCTPEGTYRLISFTKELLDEVRLNIQLAWHGHNDKGLALANALAAIEAGSNIISGTFLGIGERAGNIPLEQLLYILYEAGNRMYKLDKVVAICQLLSSCTKFDIPANFPIVGSEVFSTATGTHAAAIVKARKLGEAFEDSIFSSVYARRLNRCQSLLIGPNSGRKSIEAVLEDMHMPVSKEVVSALLTYCKQSKGVLSNLTIREIVKRVLASQKQD